MAVASPRLSVRPMEEKDRESFLSYWTDAPREVLEQMGVEPEKVPSRAALSEAVTRWMTSPPEKTDQFVSIWMVDGEAVGHSALKRIVFGDSGDMHLHMWKPALRGEGNGATLFCLSALDFFQRFQLRRVVCEPKASNPAPNRMLERIGFTLEKTWTGRSSELCAVAELATWRIDEEVARRYGERSAR